MSFLHYVHSTDPQTGGVAEAVKSLNEALRAEGVPSSVHTQPKLTEGNTEMLMGHGLWQWPGRHCLSMGKKKKIPYLIYPHGMLDPWFKQAYPLKHFKKQVYWWLVQREVLSRAYAVCFTTEEEMKLAEKSFWPYHCNPVVTGLGINDPPEDADLQETEFQKKFTQVKGKKVLLYLGRFDPKKGLDLLLNAFLENPQKNELLALAGPFDEKDSFHRKLRKSIGTSNGRVLWCGMLQGNLKWGALRTADALILPSHQENYGMVVAEALSVGTPVFLSNKVNLWREVDSCKAGFVTNDDQLGVNLLLKKWKGNAHSKMRESACLCFKERMHVRKTARLLIEMKEMSFSNDLVRQ